MKINREGYKIILCSGVLFASICLAVYYLSCNCANRALVVALTAAPLLVLWGFVIAFFREPKRPLLQDDELIFSPCDGKVVVTETVFEDEALREEVMQISIFMSVTNVHINWVPVSGVCDYFKYHPGKFLVAWHPKSSTENERTTTVVKMNDGRRILFRQIAGLVARRIVSYMKEGVAVQQNSHSGFIKFGSRIDIFVPKNSEVLVNIGDKVVGSQTPIVRLKK